LKCLLRLLLPLNRPKLHRRPHRKLLLPSRKPKPHLQMLPLLSPQRVKQNNEL
jgi:hypothetical protein